MNYNGSMIKNRLSRIVFQRLKIVNCVSRIENHISRIADRGSRIVYRGSRIVYRGSRIRYPGSKIGIKDQVSILNFVHFGFP